MTTRRRRRPSSPSCFFLLISNLLYLLSFTASVTSSFTFSPALVNVTVERDDGAIEYFPQGAWLERWPGIWDSEAPGARATLHFTGAAVYYEAFLWDTPTLLVAQIDDGLPITLDLTDTFQTRQEEDDDDDGSGSPTVPVTILLVSGLEDAPHTLVITRPESQPTTFIGKFIYSTAHPPTILPPSPNPSRFSSAPHPSQTTPSSSAPSSSTPPSAPSSSAPSARRDLQVYPAIFGTLGALFLLIGIFLGLWLGRRRYMRRGRQLRQDSLMRFQAMREQEQQNRTLLKKPTPLNLPPLAIEGGALIDNTNANVSTVQGWSSQWSPDTAEPTPAFTATTFVPSHAKPGGGRGRTWWAPWRSRNTQNTNPNPPRTHLDLDLEPNVILVTPLEKEHMHGWTID